MPLRDHFHPPLSKKKSWEGFHGQWPAMIVMALGHKLPQGYDAEPRAHLGAYYEIDVASYEVDVPAGIAQETSARQTSEADGGVATAIWAPPQPTLTVETNFPDQYEYEVRVYDTEHDRRLVAAVEIVSPANKDRPENRRLFVAKCAALLAQQVCVAIVDMVTTRRFNLYGDLLDLIGERDPSLDSGPPPLYAAVCRFRREGGRPKLETWAHAFALGQPLPTLPLWLADDLAVPLELDASYEETCRALRIQEW
ncbi:MAG TPA: DUF4058 family protein [Pirellulales bacterium]|nr:DUF4058 family protein [Pirellulales bacterium]